MRWLALLLLLASCQSSAPDSWILFGCTCDNNVTVAAADRAKEKRK